MGDERGQAVEFVGNFTSYRPAREEPHCGTAQAKRETALRCIAAPNAGKALLEKERQDVEEQIMLLEEQKEELERALASPDLYLDETVSKETVESYHAVQEQLAQCYARWEELVEQLQEG